LEKRTVAARSKKPDDDKNRIQTFRKMIDVLGCFSTIDRHLSLAQIAETAGLPRTTVHRILAALREIGFIEQDIRGGNYGLGIRLFELGSLALANMDLHREAKPFVDRLARLAEEAVHVGVFNGNDIVVVEREESGDRPANNSTLIETAPAYCTGVGKAVLAFQDRQVIAKVVKSGLKRFTNNTITSATTLDRELAKIRRQGFAVDNGEHQIWVHCVAAPIRDANGRVFAGISVTGPAERIGEDRIPILSRQVMQTADSISRHLGYRGDEA
jgi:DNA-binding IclR family transcriptional regulator